LSDRSKILEGDRQTFVPSAIFKLSDQRRSSNFQTSGDRQTFRPAAIVKLSDQRRSSNFQTSGDRQTFRPAAIFKLSDQRQQSTQRPQTNLKPPHSCPQTTK
jgi:hypothetical protein